MEIIGRRGLAVAAGLVVDRLVGEPSAPLHPVVWFGRVMRRVEGSTYGDGRGRGSLHAAIGVALGMGAGGLVGSTAAATAVASAGRALGRAATDVADALERGDRVSARRLLPGLVGREPDGLDEREMARATVESVAENTVDAVVAPALWALVAGATGALGYRAVNTLDAMVGHRNDRYRRYGWASARLDDVAGWVPARTAAALVAAVRPRQGAQVWRAVCTQAAAHPSPNSGVAEAAFAGALGLRLGGENRYGDRIEIRSPLGFGRPPEVGDIGRSVALLRDVTAALAVAMMVTAAAAQSHHAFWGHRQVR